MKDRAVLPVCSLYLHLVVLLQFGTDMYMVVRPLPLSA